MKQNRIFLVVLLILIVAHGSDASLFGKIRKLVETEQKVKPGKVSSPSPSPVSSVNSDHTVKSNNNEPANSPKDDSLGELTDERCKMSSQTCHDQGKLTACLQFSLEGSGELLLLVQNDGENTLKVNSDILPKIPFKEMQLHKQQAEKINFTKYVGKNILIVLTAGNGNCTIHMEAPKSGNIFQLLPSYVTQVTPIHGAYLLSLTALIIGGTWACCKWGRRGRRVDGIPYQELEMGQPHSFSVNNVETAEGWDESWGNDWDEEEAVNTLHGNHLGNGSVNGLNSRPSKRDGWGNDWDD